MPSDAEPAAGWSEFSDAQLIAKVRGGQIAAYAGLFERHHAAAVGFARRYARNRSDAEDLASEGFANVLSALQTGSGPEVFFRAYLFATVVRSASRLNINDSRQSLGDDMAQFDVADVDPVLAEFESRTVRKAFQSLPERWQAVLWYTEIERRKPGAVAPLLGLTANAVSALAVRAREGLRQAYLQQHIPASDDGSECSRHVAFLGAYARGGMGSRARVRIQRHLADCPKCTAIYLQLMDIGGGMRGGGVT